MTKAELIELLRTDAELREALREVVRSELIYEPPETGELVFHEPYSGMLDTQIGAHGAVQYLIGRDSQVATEAEVVQEKLENVQVAAAEAAGGSTVAEAMKAGTLCLTTPGTFYRQLKLGAWRALEAYGPLCSFVRVVDGDLVINIGSLVREGLVDSKQSPAVIRRALMSNPVQRGVRALRKPLAQKLGWIPMPAYSIILLGAAPTYGDP